MSHTPGPWHVVAERGSVVIVTPARGDTIRLIDDSPRLEADANASLIAAAPELLLNARGAWHLCQSILATREGATDELIRELADALQAAIAKAEGR